MSDFTDVRAVIFDYGGTLDTNARHWAHVIWEGYQKVEIPVDEATFREAYVFAERALAKAPIIKPSDNFRDLLGKKMDIQTGWLAEHGLWTADDTERVLRAEAVADYCYDYARRHVEAAREVVLSLKERYRLVLVSNFYGNIETILHDFSLDVFETIVESTVVGVRKPDPAIYRLGVEATGVAAEQVVVIGDSFSKDIVPAHAVGCKTIWLKGEGWGGEQEDDSLADVVISDIKDVLIYL